MTTEPDADTPASDTLDAVLAALAAGDHALADLIAAGAGAGTSGG